MLLQAVCRCRPQIATLPTGEIDYAQLEEQLRLNVARPAIINVNIGTTVRVVHRQHMSPLNASALMAQQQRGDQHAAEARSSKRS